MILSQLMRKCKHDINIDWCTYCRIVKGDKRLESVVKAMTPKVVRRAVVDIDNQPILNKK